MKYKFKVGDKVKVKRYNGIFTGEIVAIRQSSCCPYGIKTVEEVNTCLGEDWVKEFKCRKNNVTADDSELVKQCNGIKPKFKKGDKIYVEQYKDWGIIEDLSISLYGVRMADGIYKAVGIEDRIEKYIEPKYKVGDKFMLLTGGSYIKSEIVKLSLNKKKKQYSYLMFDTDGYARAVNEEVLDVTGKIITKCIKCTKCGK